MKFYIKLGGKNKYSTADVVVTMDNHTDKIRGINNNVSGNNTSVGIASTHSKGIVRLRFNFCLALSETRQTLHQ